MTEYEYKQIWRVIRKCTNKTYKTIISRKNHSIDNKHVALDGFNLRKVDTGDGVYCCLTYYEQMFRDTLSEESITPAEYWSMMNMFESIIRRRYALVRDYNMRSQGIYYGEIVKVEQAVWRWYNEHIKKKLERGDDVSEPEIMLADWDLPF